MAVNHPIVDVVQNPEKVNTDISFTPLSQRTIVLDVDQTFRAGATRHQYNKASHFHESAQTGLCTFETVRTYHMRLH